VPIDTEDTLAWIAVLKAATEAAAENGPIDQLGLCELLGRDRVGVDYLIERVAGAGLASFGEVNAERPIVTDAGREYPAAGGDVPEEELLFLPHAIQSLIARRALLQAGTVLVDEFRCAHLEGNGVAHARSLVPEAFTAVVDDQMALNLYSAAVALMARLSAEQPAGCVAEEIIAVGLIEEARVRVDLWSEEHAIGAADADRARDELQALFDLFEDDDVLALFTMAEPADAAVAGQDPVKQDLGVVDQRVEAWFRPFSWTAPTGYLDDGA
jgi:hypothetical protein